MQLYTDTKFMCTRCFALGIYMYVQSANWAVPITLFCSTTADWCSEGLIAVLYTCEQ